MVHWWCAIDVAVSKSTNKERGCSGAAGLLLLGPIPRSHWKTIISSSSWRRRCQALLMRCKSISMQDTREIIPPRWCLKTRTWKLCLCVCVCVERGSSCKHDQRLIFYPKDLWGKASLLARLFAVIYEGVPVFFNLSFYALKVWLVFSMWLSCFNQCKTMLTLSTSRLISSE